MDRNIAYFGLVAIVLAALPFVTASDVAAEAVTASNTAIEARPVRLHVGLRLRAAGAGITSDGSDYHVFGIAAREIRVPAISTDAESNVARVLGGMRFGEEKYRLAGERTDNHYAFRVFSVDVNRTCLVREDLDSCGTPIGYLEVDRLDNYENVPHFLVGNLEISGRDYLVTGRGWRIPALKKAVGKPVIAESKAVTAIENPVAVVSEEA